MTTPTTISPAMLAAFADLKSGPLQRHHHAFVSTSGRRHHSNAISGLVERALANVRPLGFRRAETVLTPLGSLLRPESEDA